jgi:hypothetical protein
VQRFEFRLDGVLKLKKQRRRLAEQQQMQARAALDAARAAVMALQEQLDEVGMRQWRAGQDGSRVPL